MILCFKIELFAGQRPHLFREKLTKNWCLRRLGRTTGEACAWNEAGTSIGWNPTIQWSDVFMWRFWVKTPWISRSFMYRLQIVYKKNENYQELGWTWECTWNNTPCLQGSLAKLPLRIYNNSQTRPIRCKLDRHSTTVFRFFVSSIKCTLKSPAKYLVWPTLQSVRNHPLHIFLLANPVAILRMPCPTAVPTLSSPDLYLGLILRLGPVDLAGDSFLRGSGCFGAIHLEIRNPWTGVGCVFLREKLYIFHGQNIGDVFYRKTLSFMGKNHGKKNWKKHGFL